MTPQERRRYSEDLRQRARYEFDCGGDARIASELLWNAAAQLLLAALDYHPQWEFRGHGYYSFAARELEMETASDVLHVDEIQADSLHVNFYENNLTANEITAARAAVCKLIAALERYLDSQEAANQLPPT